MERKFYRIDHFATAMGELVSDVAVTADDAYEAKDYYYRTLRVTGRLCESLSVSRRPTSIGGSIPLDLEVLQE